MADTKITALTALTAADPSTDVLPIVDTSDTTMAASGTTKKISINNILGASGTATLASATISGDLTVDTNTLKVVSSLDFVAIGATAQSFGEKFRINGNYTVMNDGAFTGFLGKASAIGASGSTTDFGIRSENALVFLTNGATEQMRLNSTGLGVGYTPSGSADKLGSAATLGVVATGVTADLNFRNSSLTAIQRIRYTDGTGVLTIGSASTVSYQVELGGNTTTRAVTIDSSSNVLVGTTSGTFRGTFVVAGGANRDILAAGVTAVSDGFQVKWNHATTKINVIISNMPTSSAGLAAGTLWNDAGTIKIA